MDSYKLYDEARKSVLKDASEMAPRTPVFSESESFQSDRRIFEEKMKSSILSYWAHFGNICYAFTSPTDNSLLTNPVCIKNPDRQKYEELFRQCYVSDGKLKCEWNSL